MDSLPPGPPSLKRQLTGQADYGDERPPAERIKTESPTQLSSPADGASPGGAYNVCAGGVTDPGVPGRVNQDSFFIWSKGDGLTYAMGVFDGHGRELGQLAAEAATNAFKNYLCNDETLAQFRKRPKVAMHEAFKYAHEAVAKAFRRHNEENGCTVSSADRGFMIRRRGPGRPWECVHGGTTATLVLVLDGEKVIIGNVGDSTALLCGYGSDGLLRPVEEFNGTVASPQVKDEEMEGGGGGGSKAGKQGKKADKKGNGNSDAAGEESKGSGKSHVLEKAHVSTDAFIELSADHSPESHSEFHRIRTAHPCPHRNNHPELQFVYDTLSPSKLSCPPVFLVDPKSGSATRTSRGSYYKNVRNEWATLVSTPSYSTYQDALAFTRSIGDLHLQTYGVTHEPETRWFSLVDSSSRQGILPFPFAIVLCSDGVWDNWKYEEVSSFVLHPLRLDAVKKECAKPDRDLSAVETGAAQDLSKELMVANKKRAFMNFGNSADNMTAVVAMFIPKEGATSNQKGFPTGFPPNRAQLRL